MFEKFSQPGAPLRNRTVDLLLTMHNSPGFTARQALPAGRGKRRSGSCPGLRHLRSLRPSRLQPRSSWHGSMPSQRQRPAAPGLPFKPGLWGCMPASHVHSDGQRTVRRSFLSRPPKDPNTTLSRRFPIARGKFEPVSLSAPRRKPPAAAQESRRAQDHTAEHVEAQSQAAWPPERGQLAPVRPNLPN